MPPKPFDLEIELPKAIARLRELADDDGLAPMQLDYNKQRGAGCASTTFFESRGVSYSELVRRAGLRQRRRGPQPKANLGKPSAQPSTDVPPEVEAEIKAAFARGDHIDQRRKDWPMFAIPTRVETVLIPQGNATALKITRYYASIR